MKITIDITEEEFATIIGINTKPKSKPDTTKYYQPISLNYTPYDIIDDIEVYYINRTEMYVTWYGKYLADSIRNTNVETLVKFTKLRRKG